MLLRHKHEGSPCTDPGSTFRIGRWVLCRSDHRATGLVVLFDVDTGGQVSYRLAVASTEPIAFKGLPWCFRGYRTWLQGGRHGFDPWVGRIPWRREWLPNPVFLSGGSHGQSSLAGYSP